MNDKYDGPGWKPGGGYESGEDYLIRTHGDRPVQTPSSNEPPYETGDDFNARIYANRTSPVYGAKLNGESVQWLVEHDRIKPEDMKEEDFKIVYEQIMYGYTKDKNVLAKEIDLIISDKELIREMVTNQFLLAMEEASRERKSYNNLKESDRKYQLLATLCILKEKGFDLGLLTYGNENTKKYDFVELLSVFRKACRECDNKSIYDSPYWFKGEPPEYYQESFYGTPSPESVSTQLIKDEFSKNPDRFFAQWADSRKNTNLDIIRNRPFDRFMSETFGFVPAVLTDKQKELALMVIEQNHMDDDTLYNILSEALYPNSYDNNEGKKM